MSHFHILYYFKYIYIYWCVHPRGSENCSVKGQILKYFRFCRPVSFTSTQLCFGHGCLPIKLYLWNQAAARFVSLLTPDIDYNFPWKLFPRSSAPRNSQFSSAKCVINNAAESYTQNVTNFFALQACTLVFKANCNNFYQL